MASGSAAFKRAAATGRDGDTVEIMSETCCAVED